MDRRLLEALAVTIELTGTQASEAAIRIMAADLSAYPLNQVLGALRRCRLELKGRLTVAEVVSRLDDGRPGPEEAWAMIPHDEAGSVVWTAEMAQAFGVAQPLIACNDLVAARMAFTERYRALVSAARSDGVPPQWSPSFGTDRFGREDAVSTAVQKGRMLPNHAQQLLPDYSGDQSLVVLERLKELAAPSSDGRGLTIGN